MTNVKKNKLNNNLRMKGKFEFLYDNPVKMVYYDIGDRDRFIKEIQEKCEVVDYEIRFYTSNNVPFFIRFK